MVAATVCALLSMVIFSARVQAAPPAIAKAGTDTNTTATTLNFNFNHTLVTGNNRLVVVAIGTESEGAGSPNTVSSVTYGGVEMTAAVTADPVGTGTPVYATSGIWYLLEDDLPANGANAIAVTSTGGSNQYLNHSAFAAQYDNVKQQAPEATHKHNQTSGTTVSNTITPSDNAWVVSSVLSGNLGSFTHGQSQAEVYDATANGTSGSNGATFSVAELRGADGESSLSSTYSGSVNRLQRLAVSFVGLSSYSYLFDDGEGDGTLENPYEINDCEQLQAINTNAETRAAHYQLVSNIDCSMTNPDSDNWDDGGTWADGNGFLPIGKYYNGDWWETSGFSGSLNGSDGEGGRYAITDLYIDRNMNRVGLFAEIEDDAEISNLRLEDVDITNDTYVTGGLVGLAYGTITNVSVSGEVHSDDNSVGGLVGAHEGWDTIINSHSSANVSGHWAVGGLVGENYGNIYDSSATGTVTGYEDVGGLVGHIGTWAEDEDLEIHDSWAEGNVIGRYQVGGLIGEADGDNYSISVARSHATGNVTMTEGEDYGNDFGGLIGDADRVDITDSYAEGTVSTEGINESYSIGGLVGYLYNSTVVDSYAEGNVTGGTPSVGGSYGSDEVGGLVGYTESSEITGSSATGDVQGTSEVGGLVGYTYSDTVEAWNEEEEEWYDELIETVITDSYAVGDVSGNGEVGGLVGDLNGTHVARSYATGSVTGNTVTFYWGYWDEDEFIVEEEEEEQSYSIGGLVGQVDSSWYEYYNGDEWVEEDSYSTVSQSYATGNVSGNENLGGLVGEHQNDNLLEDSYARGNVTGVDEDPHDIGAAIGENDGLVNNVYATGKVTATGSNDIGGLIGDNDSEDGVVTNSFWDRQTTGQATSDGGTGKTTAQMKNVATFTKLSSSGLAQAWDFVGNPNDDNANNNIWSIGSGLNNGYPCLTWQAEAELCVNLAVEDTDDNDSVAPGIENAGPNGGDANNDGTLDSQQPHVTSFVNPKTGKYVAVVLDEGCLLTASSVTSEASNSVKDAGFDYKSGLLNFTADCGEPGFTTHVTIYHYGVKKNGLVLRKYNPTTGAYFTVTDAGLSQQTIGGQSVAVATYGITDGGKLDVDGLKNGIIVDPVGLASPVVGAPNTGLGGRQ